MGEIIGKTRPITMRGYTLPDNLSFLPHITENLVEQQPQIAIHAAIAMNVYASLLT
jgi:hypothetical protein